MLLTTSVLQIRAKRIVVDGLYVGVKFQLICNLTHCLLLCELVLVHEQTNYPQRQQSIYNQRAMGLQNENKWKVLSLCLYWELKVLTPFLL